MRKQFDFDDFYEKCLVELQSRPNWSDAFEPVLERYCVVTAELAKLNNELRGEPLSVKHTNRNYKTNDKANPKWKMFAELNREAIALAKELKLSPATAPVAETKKKKGFDLGNGENMKKAV